MTNKKNNAHTIKKGAGMKNLVFWLIFCSAIAANAGISAGLSFQFDYSYENISLTDNSQSKSNVTLLMPVCETILRIPMSPVLEIVPMIGIECDPESLGGSNKVVLGCGWYYQILKSGFFAVSTGPNLGARFNINETNNTFDLGMPLNLDLQLNPKWSIRMATTLAQIQYNITDNANISDGTFSFSLNTVIYPSFSVFYTF